MEKSFQPLSTQKRNVFGEFIPSALWHFITSQVTVIRIHTISVIVAAAKSSRPSS